MEEVFKVTDGALVELFDSYYDFKQKSNTNIQSREAGNEIKNVTPQDVEENSPSVLITSLFVRKGDLKGPEKQFYFKVLAAIGINPSDSAILCSSEFDSSIENILENQESNFVFLWGDGLKEFSETTLYTRHPFQETELLKLNSIEHIMTNVEEKRQLWALLKNINVLRN